MLLPPSRVLETKGVLLFLGEGCVSLCFGAIWGAIGTGGGALLDSHLMIRDFFPQRTTTLYLWMLGLKTLEPTATGMLPRGGWTSRGCWMTWR